MEGGWAAGGAGKILMVVVMAMVMLMLMQLMLISMGQGPSNLYIQTPDRPPLAAVYW